MRQALLILAKSMILGAGSSVLFALGLHLVISEHWALDRIGRNHVDTWITVAIVWFCFPHVRGGEPPLKHCRWLGYRLSPRAWG